MFHCGGIIMDCSHIKKLLRDYLDESIKISTEDNQCNLVFPIFGHDNDLVNFYIKNSSNKENKYYITDKGETIDTLYTLGVEIKDEGTKTEILESICAGLNIKIKDNEIIAYANDEDIGFTISRIISSILGIQYLRYISRPIHIPAFKNDVRTYLKENRPDFAEDVPIEGESGDFKFDFGYLEEDIYFNTLYAPQNRNAQLISEELCLRNIDIKKKNSKIKIGAIYDDVDKTSKTKNKFLK